ncbi:TonB-dependent receptor [Luteimonas sp BLCC-B24]|uniref:TonB-dependent receptor n=1 Tax=Luteimonas sp. BLCC-B24 TaxID=3025317 RepID=UPI00234D2FD1|nr:TonB-dependent receptor [Luteimonas sp. BLCC-B24]MDC7806441.1 TonB-dependent receptor [Luteimonas sp. BLCC-B24]
MSKLDRNLLSAALSSALLMLAAGAHAQTTTTTTGATPAAGDATELDRVTVTGIRRGIESAIAVKRDATSIVESVSAEDIGKLPDVSIAESIARLPGLSAQRVAGRAQVISVRGLSPDFATTLLNGREMVSTGDNRSVEFDQYPSELVSGVTVYKTPDAALVGQGLSGTLDMQTVRPLNFAEPVITLSGRFQRNSLGEAADTDPYGNRLSASWIGQSADRRIGFSIGVSHSDTPIQENQVGLYEPWKTDERPGLAEGTWSTDGMKALRRTGYTKRDGIMATLQFRPSNLWTSTLDMFHSRAEQEDTANQFEVNTQYNGSFPCDPACVYSNVRTSENGSFAGGTLTGVYPLVRGMYNRREDRISAFGWGNEFNFERARLTTDISWSKAKRNEISLENNAQRLPNPSLDTIELDIRRNGFTQMAPGLDYSDPGQLFLTNTIYGSGYGKTPRVEDELKGARVGLTLPAPSGLTWLADFDFGVNYADREKAKRQPEGNINLGAQGDTAIAGDLQYGLVDLGFAGIGYIPAWNVPGAVGRYMTFEPTEDLDYLIPKAWTVSEKITTAFARANISSDWGDTAVTGNIGVQIQRVDQSSASNYWDATQPAGSNVRPFEDGKTYTDVLPSMNLAFALPNEHTVRIGLAEQVARPRVDQLRSSLEFGVDDQGRPGGSGGNPLLDPWRAYAFDISWEKYFGNRAYVAAAFFYKDLRTYIYTETRDGYDFSGLLANYVPRPGASPITQTTGNFTAPQNAEGGTLRGLELTASLPFDLWSESLRGFGIVASASFNDSSIQIFDPESANSVGSGPIDLPGLSKRVYNLTAYYERNGFEARVSQRRRSDFIGEIGNFDGARTLRYVVGENITDAQLSYSFGDGSSLDGLTLLLQANNLTNAAYQTYAGTRDRPLEYIQWGRTYLLGLNYRF